MCIETNEGKENVKEFHLAKVDPYIQQRPVRVEILDLQVGIFVPVACKALKVIMKKFSGKVRDLQLNKKKFSQKSSTSARKKRDEPQSTTSSSEGEPAIIQSKLTQHSRVKLNCSKMASETQLFVHNHWDLHQVLQLPLIDAMSNSLL